MDFIRTIQQALEAIREALRSSTLIKALRAYVERVEKDERIRQNILQAIPFWFAAALVGLVAVLYAAMFGWAEDMALELHKLTGWGIFIIMPVCMIAAWLLVRRFAPGARGSGIPQVIAALEMANADKNANVSRLLSLRIIIIKIISSMLMVLGGTSIGREGPTIQISSAIFLKINALLPSWWPKVSSRNMILTGAAAGLAAAFNTPLGGIVFAVEELSRVHISNFRTAIFTAVIIAGLTAQAVAGSYLFLGLPDTDNSTATAFWGVLLVAAIAGLAGAFSSKLILKILAWKDRFKHVGQHLAYMVAISLVLSAIIHFVSPQSMGSGKEVINDLLFTAEKDVPWYLPLVRIFGPVLSFSSGASGGIFAPALSAGASVGALVASWFNFSPDDINLLVIAGMAAFLTGLTRSPFTSAILVLEMTDRHSLIFHLMAAGMVANLVAYFIDRKSLYEHLKQRFLKDAGFTPAAKLQKDEGDGDENAGESPEAPRP